MVTQAERNAAQKVLEQWQAQEAAKAKAQADQRAAARTAAVDSWMAEKGDLTGWALEQWSRDKAAGVGCGMEPDAAITYTLGALRLAVDKVQSVDDYIARRDAKDPTP